MVRERVRERERGELPDRVTYIQNCLESASERERQRGKGERGGEGKERSECRNLTEMKIETVT